MKKISNNKAITLGIVLLVCLVLIVLLFLNGTDDSQTANTEIDNQEISEKSEIELRQEVIEADGQYFDYLIQGNNYLAEGDLESAHRQYEEAEKLAGDNMDVLVALAKSYQRIGNTEKAIEYYERVIEKASNPENPYHVNLSSYQDGLASVKDGSSESGDYEIPL